MDRQAYANLKKNLIEWLFEHSKEEILIRVELGERVIYPFVPAAPDSVILKIRYALALHVDETGISAKISCFPRTEHCFFPWDSIKTIVAENKCGFNFFDVPGFKIVSSDVIQKAESNKTMQDSNKRSNVIPFKPRNQRRPDDKEPA